MKKLKSFCGARCGAMKALGLKPTSLAFKSWDSLSWSYEIIIVASQMNRDFDAAPTVMIVIKDRHVRIRPYASIGQY